MAFKLRVLLLPILRQILTIINAFLYFLQSPLRYHYIGKKQTSQSCCSSPHPLHNNPVCCFLGVQVCPYPKFFEAFRLAVAYSLLEITSKEPFLLGRLKPALRQFGCLLTSICLLKVTAWQSRIPSFCVLLFALPFLKSYHWDRDLPTACLELIAFNWFPGLGLITSCPSARTYIGAWPIFNLKKNIWWLL